MRTYSINTYDQNNKVLAFNKESLEQKINREKLENNEKTKRYKANQYAQSRFNTILFKEGGISIDPDNKISKLLDFLNNNSTIGVNKSISMNSPLNSIKY